MELSPRHHRILLIVHTNIQGLGRQNSSHLKSFMQRLRQCSKLAQYWSMSLNLVLVPGPSMGGSAVGVKGEKRLEEGKK